MPYTPLFPSRSLPPQLSALQAPAATGTWGQYSIDGTYDGVDGDISVDSITLPAGPNDAHEINYLDQTDYTRGCDGYATCWIQGGYGEGNVTNHIAPSLRPYFEATGTDGPYQAKFVTAFGLTQDDYVFTYNTELTDANGNYLWESWIEPTTLSPQELGSVYLPSESSTAFASSEAVNINTVNVDCPTLARYEYFGTNGSGAAVIIRRTHSNWEPQAEPVTPYGISLNIMRH